MRIWFCSNSWLSRIIYLPAYGPARACFRSLKSQSYKRLLFQSLSLLGYILSQELDKWSPPSCLGQLDRLLLLEFYPSLLGIHSVSKFPNNFQFNPPQSHILQLSHNCKEECRGISTFNYFKQQSHSSLFHHHCHDDD